MKKLLSSFALLLLTTIAHSTCLYQNMENSSEEMLTVQTKDGGFLQFLLSEDPVITFSDRTIRLKSDSQKCELELSNVARFYFSFEGTGIGNIEKSDLTISKLADGFIEIEGLEQNTTIKLYGVDGKNLPLKIVNSKRKTIVYTDSLIAGIYILSINNKTIKFIKK